MTLIAALLLSVLVALLITENYGYGYWMISRPIFAGPLIGLILGDLQTGLIVGASVELMFMGVLPIGGSVPRMHKLQELSVQFMLFKLNPQL